MRLRLLALTLGLLLLCVGAGPAAAGEPLAGQVADQSADNQQTATSNASSAQYHPTNSNISVRVLSPGDDGSVEQRNSSTAGSLAANGNSTNQAIDQSQTGSGKGCCKSGSTAVQEAGQWAGNEQSAESSADSTQYHPTNSNISVRVLSPGDNGSVEQKNSSTALSAALNKNETTQEIDQSQTGSGACCKKHPRWGDGGSTAIQAAGQDAYSRQDADSWATSTQKKPSNENLSARVKSKGDDGSVEQENSSTALSAALNKNETTQDIDQSQTGSGRRCCGSDPTAIQAAGQKAFNSQEADSSAYSTQFHPSNFNGSLRLKSRGHGGSVEQQNNSFAASLAANLNDLDQTIVQNQVS